MGKIDKLDFEINEKNFKRLLIIGIVIMICYLMITFLSFSIPRIYKMDKNTVIDTEGVVKTGINRLERGRIRLELFGWAYKDGQAIETFESYFVLKNQEDGRMYKLNAELTEIPQLTTVDEKYNCANSGLYSQSIILGLKDGIYDIYILYKNDNENLLVNTNVQVQI